MKSNLFALFIKPSMVYQSFYSLADLFFLSVLIFCRFPTNHSTFQQWMIIVQFLECAMHFFFLSLCFCTCSSFIQGCCLPLPPPPSPFFHCLHLITVLVWYHYHPRHKSSGRMHNASMARLHEIVLLSAPTAFHISPNTALSALCANCLLPCVPPTKY